MQKNLEDIYTMDEFKEWIEENPELFSEYSERQIEKMTKEGQEINNFLKQYENCEYKHEIIKALEFAFELEEKYKED